MNRDTQIPILTAKQERPKLPELRGQDNEPEASTIPRWRSSAPDFYILPCIVFNFDNLV
jgi:hypothetical protein